MELQYYDLPLATVDKKSSIYFSLVELEIVLCTYGEYEHIFRKKVTCLQHKEERIGMGENYCFNKCISLNVAH